VAPYDVWAWLWAKRSSTNTKPPGQIFPILTERLSLNLQVLLSGGGGGDLRWGPSAPSSVVSSVN